MTQEVEQFEDWRDQKDELPLFSDTSAQVEQLTLEHALWQISVGEHRRICRFIGVVPLSSVFAEWEGSINPNCKDDRYTNLIITEDDGDQYYFYWIILEPGSL